ncbi:MAG TPA: CRISPR-associated endoribonuclease Cas6, partial [Caldanaerobacter subterraneus]
QLALDAGLGSKNSQGYGCCRLLEEGKTYKGGEKSG